MGPGQLPASPPNVEEYSAISEEEDSEYKETFSFTHTPYIPSHSFNSDTVEMEGNQNNHPHGAAPEGGQPESGKKNSCNVYISNLPSGVDDAWLRKEFGRYGLITSAKVMQAYSKKRVYAFVQYTEEHMANAAVEGANGVFVGTYPLVVKHADRDKDKGLPNEPSNNLYVSNLPTDFGVADLERIFSPYGQVCSSVVLTHPQTGVGRGVGLVRYFCIEDATAAIQGLHGTVLDGHDRPLEVKYAEDQETKQIRKMPKKHTDQAKVPEVGKGRPKQSTPQAPKTAARVQKHLQLDLNLVGSDVQEPRCFQTDPPSAPPTNNSFTEGTPPKSALPPPDPQASVYIGGLPRDLQTLHAYQLFAPFGALISIDLQPDPRADTSYAYIQYRWHSDALHAVEQLDGAILAGRRLYSTIHSPQMAQPAGMHA